jgi:hypothetical protein
LILFFNWFSVTTAGLKSRRHKASAMSSAKQPGEGGFGAFILVDAVRHQSISAAPGFGIIERHSSDRFARETN